MKGFCISGITKIGCRKGQCFYWLCFVAAENRNKAITTAKRAWQAANKDVHLFDVRSHECKHYFPGIRAWYQVDYYDFSKWFN